ncbi:MAG: RNA polymerase sigma factor [Planctomycetota bacterium]
METNVAESAAATIESKPEPNTGSGSDEASHSHSRLDSPELAGQGTHWSEPIAEPDQDAGSRKATAPPSAANSDDVVDESIINEWISEFSGDVYRYLYWLSGNPNTAEDITQETFLRTVKALRSGSGPHDLNKAKAWLLTVARNEFLRACQKQRIPQSNGLENTVEEATPEEGSRLDEAEWLHHGLAQLKSDSRIVVVMHYFEQASYAEIAETLQIPIGTVMSRLSRAKAQLRTLLDDDNST